MTFSAAHRAIQSAPQRTSCALRCRACWDGLDATLQCPGSDPSAALRMMLHAGGGGGGWWAVNLVWDICRFNLAAKLPTSGGFLLCPPIPLCFACPMSHSVFLAFAKCPAAKFTAAKLTRHQIPPPPFVPSVGTTDQGKGKGRSVVRPMGTAAYRGKGQGKGKGRGEGRLGQGGRGRSKGGEKPMGTTAYGGKGSKGRAANGDRPVGAASCRRDHHTMASCQNPPFCTA